MKTLNFCFIVCGPSGVGKTTLVRDLLQSPESQLTLSISYTTRAPRGAEQNGKDYFFVDDATFEGMVENDEFAEWANVHGNKYGTSAKQITDAWERGKNVLFDIDYQGAEQLKSRFAERAVATLVIPPSLAELERRLRDRGTDTEETIALRLKHAATEMRQVALFDFVIENDDLEAAQIAMSHIYFASYQLRPLFEERVLGKLDS